MNKEIELLNNKLDAQDKIINEQVLEIARLKEEKTKAIEYIKSHTDKLKKIRVPKIDFDYKELLEILGDKKDE